MIHFVAATVILFAASVAGAQDLAGLAQLQKGKAVRASSSAEDWQKSNVDYRFIRPGETFTMADLKGPGTIRRIWLTILPSEPAYSRLMTLRIYWDGEREPSVECPLGDFFGVGHGVDSAFESLPVRASADGKARSCNWVMPFRKSARLTLTNDGTQATWGFYYMVDARKERVAKDAPYFHASYRQEFPCKPGNYIIADLQGRGHYVGTVLSCHSTSPGWWGEGDDFFYVDGEKLPSLRGTGLEDYFGEAWGLRKVSGQLAGCSLWEGGYPGARSTCYRWHIADAVPFTRSLRVEIEHKGVAFGPDGRGLGNNNERPDEFSSVGFWYQLEPHKPFPPMPAGMDRLAFDYRLFVEAESLADRAKATKGTVRAIKGNGLRGGGQLEWDKVEDGSQLSLPFSLDEAGQYQLLLLFTSRWDGALADVLIDGEPIGSMDFFTPGYETNREMNFPIQKLAKGAHTVTLRCTGKDPDANGRWFGLDGFMLQPVRG